MRLYDNVIYNLYLYNMGTILQFDNIDMNKIIFSEPVKDGKTIYIYLSYGEVDNAFIFSLPSIYTEDGFDKTFNKHVSFQINVPINCRDQKYNEQIVSFFNNLDEKIIEMLKVKADSWFEDDEQVKYKTFVHNVENDGEIYKYGLMKFKVVNSDDFKTIVYGDKDKVLDDGEINAFNKGYIKSIVEPLAIWIKNGTIGLYIRPHQFKLKGKYKRKIVLDKCMLDSDSESKEEVIIDTELKSPSLEKPNLANRLEEMKFSDSD